MTEHARKLAPVEEAPSIDPFDDDLSGTFVPDEDDTEAAPVKAETSPKTVPASFPTPIHATVQSIEDAFNAQAEQSAQPELIEGIDPEWDIALVVNRGHVNIARAEQIVEMVAPLALASLLLGLLAIFSRAGIMFSGTFGNLAYWICLLLGGFFAVKLVYAVLVKRTGLFIGPLMLVGMLALAAVGFAGAYVGYLASHGFGVSNLMTFDEDTYFDLGGGLRGPYRLSWMADYAPSSDSLSLDDYEKLTTALVKDIDAHGLEAAEWSNVAELPKAPIITRGAKAIREHGDKLKTGVVVVPKDLAVVAVLAHVEGKWSAAIIGGRKCAVILGPVPKTCDDQTKPEFESDSNANSIVAGKFPTLVEKFEIDPRKAQPNTDIQE